MRTRLACLVAAAALILPAATALAASDALAKIVDGACVPDQQANSKPAPCTSVDLAGHYVILKDLAGASQFLLIAINPDSGIESADLEAAGAPDYFADAWAARHDMDDRLGKPVPRDDVGLAINSVEGRSQDRLHIHIDCVRADVTEALTANAAAIGTSWAPLPGGLLGHPYRALRVASADLAGINPFALLTANLPPDDPKMGDETLVAVAVTLPDKTDGFYLLADHAGATVGDRASGEELLDHTCAILK